MATIRRIKVASIVVLMEAFAVFLLLNFHAGSASAKDESNDKPPSVNITAPKNNSIYDWNSLVSYNIVVSDHGKSTEYNEIPANEVLLKTTYVPDLSHMSVNSNQTAKPSPAGLADIINSNCLGCHEFKSKAMGPSFFAIGKRYPDTESTIDILSQHIRSGSVGVWGQAPMPSHPEFTEEELHAISSWIVKQAADPNVNYYVGTGGTFQMESPGKPGPSAGVMLTAGYTSHDSKNRLQQALRGEDTIIVGGK
jgi:cytochrome c